MSRPIGLVISQLHISPTFHHPRQDWRVPATHFSPALRNWCVARIGSYSCWRVKICLEIVRKNLTNIHNQLLDVRIFFFSSCTVHCRLTSLSTGDSVSSTNSTNKQATLSTLDCEVLNVWESGAWPHIIIMHGWKTALLLKTCSSLRLILREIQEVLLY